VAVVERAECPRYRFAVVERAECPRYRYRALNVPDIELNVPDIDLLQILYSGAYYQADLPYFRSAEVVLLQGQKKSDKSSSLLFGLVFNALLLALQAT
jgi:hypothetical protein